MQNSELTEVLQVVCHAAEKVINVSIFYKIEANARKKHLFSSV